MVNIVLLLVCTCSGLRNHLPSAKQFMKNYRKEETMLRAIYLGSESEYVPKNRQLVAGIEIEIIESAILDFLPSLEVHHIVVVRDTNVKNGGVYSIDFSPLNQASLKTLTKLTFCQSVPGEIRLRHIPEEKVTIEEIKNNCMCVDLTLQSLGNMLNPIHHSSMGTLSHLRRKPDDPIKNIGENDGYKIALSNVKNRRIADAVLEVVKGWNTNMNLYLHNCQHFSYYCVQSLRDSLE